MKIPGVVVLSVISLGLPAPAARADEQIELKEGRDKNQEMIQMLRRKKEELEADLQILRAKYTPAHRKVVDAENVIRNVDERISQLQEPSGGAFLGVALSAVPEPLLAHLSIEGGAIVQELVAGSPAEKAGVKLHDVIVSMNGEPVAAPADLQKRIRSAKSGDAVKLAVRRGAETKSFDVTLGSPPPRLPEAPQPEEKEEANRPGFLGVGYSEVPPSLASHLGLSEGKGVVVDEVLKGSPAEKAGIEARDVIAAIDGKEIEGGQQFVAALSEKKSGDEVKIDFFHKGEKRSVSAVLAPRPKEAQNRWFERKVAPGFDPFGGPVDPNDQFFRPHTQRRGKIILRGPGGEERSVPLPDSFWKAMDTTEDVFESLQGKFEELKDVKIPGLKEELRKALRQLEDELGDENAQWSNTNENHSSVVRQIEGNLDITVREQNGVKTVTVLQDKKPLVEDQPLDKLDALPAGVRERVEKVANGLLPGGVRGKPGKEPRLRGGPKLDLRGSEKIRA